MIESSMSVAVMAEAMPDWESLAACWSGPEALNNGVDKMIPGVVKSMSVTVPYAVIKLR